MIAEQSERIIVLESIFNILGALFVDLPKVFLYLLMCGGIAYCASLVLIGFPVSIWEEITKKKVNGKIENKIIRIVAICLFVVLIIAFFIKDFL